MDSGRRAILEGTYAKSLCPQLRCYENLRAEIFDSNTEGNPQETMKNIAEAASCKEWQLHRDGFSPSVAEQRKVAGKHYRWIKIAAIASIASIIVIVAMRFATCSC